MKSICVIGLGYIGLPTASLLATNGHSVLGVDTNPEVVDWINSGKNHIEEVGLRTLLEAAVASGHLRASTVPAPSDVFIIAVPTPFDKKKQPDLSHVRDATQSIIPALRAGNLVVLESTVPPGATREVARRISEARPDLVGGTRDPLGTLRVMVAHCPERVLPGQILKELVENDRVIGGITPEAARRAQELYENIVSGTIYLTDATTAELVKLSENTFRDLNISFANELAVLCEKLGVNVWDVIELANKHPRVKILNPGPGVGGHCIAVDPWFLAAASLDETRVIQAARLRNDRMPGLVVQRILELASGLKRPKIALLGASYKGNVGDARNSPAVEVLNSLRKRLPEGGEVVMNDMHIKGDTLPLVPLDATLEGASIIVLLTDHAEYRSLDPLEVARTVRQKILFDTRNALDHARWVAAGFEVHVLGNGKA
jgi:UDP-N-acetyl-D-mannosaminuronic acid dehydrogenase